MAEPFDERLLALENDLQDIMGSDEESNEDANAGDRRKVARNQADKKKDRQANFVKIAANICAVVRAAQESNSPDVESIISGADETLNKAIRFAYYCGGEFSLFDNIPSFSHIEDQTLVVDKEFGEGIYSRGLLDSLLPILLKHTKKKDRAAKLPKPPPPWPETFRPHPNSTPCCRFRDADKIHHWEVIDSNVLATAVQQAKCEVSCDDIPLPTGISLSPSCLALPAMGGYKNGTAYLCYYLLNEGETGSFPTSRDVRVPLEELVFHSTVDESRKLIFVGDRNRVKSYNWGTPDATGSHPFEPLATHTLDSDDFDGPLEVLQGRRCIRAGRGSIAVWDIDTLETHGPEGKNQIGKKISMDDLWRDDTDDVESSWGSPVVAKIKLEDSTFVVHRWHTHPSAPGTMLCGAHLESKQFYCHAFDLEHGGKRSARYLGHGGTVVSFSTSAAEPSSFVTACEDGIARIYDVRHPLPVMTFDNNGGQHVSCPSAIVAHPDGIPFLFTGTEEGESIKVWDVRARACLYDLATGNNIVTAMAWDDSRSSLFAVTECNFVDQSGNYHDYRKAKIPRWQSEDMSNEDEDYCYDDDEDDDDECWPKRAYHSEDHYGFCFDSGSHRIFRYSFKADPDPHILPYYGAATIHSESDYW